MEKEQKNLQLFYSAVLADSVNHYARSGILGKVTEEKKIEEDLWNGDQCRFVIENIHLR